MPVEGLGHLLPLDFHPQFFWHHPPCTSNSSRSSSAHTLAQTPHTATYTVGTPPHTHSYTHIFPSRSACIQIFTGPIGTSPSFPHRHTTQKLPKCTQRHTETSLYTSTKIPMRKFLQFERTLKITAKAAHFTVEVTESQRMEVACWRPQGDCQSYNSQARALSPPHC